MTWKRIAAFSAIGAALWALIIFAGTHYGWAEAGKWTVMIVLALLVVAWIWRQVEKDQVKLDYEEQLREAQAYDYDEYEQPLPPAA